jgi:putative FmdB family regulatory protein
MPLYDYECKNCSYRFEVKRSISELNGSCPECTKCGSRNTARKLGNVIVLTRLNGQNLAAVEKNTCGTCSSHSSIACSGCRK